MFILRSKGDDIQLATIVDQKGRTIYSVKRHSGGPLRYFAVRMHNKEWHWVVCNSVEEFSKPNHTRKVLALCKYEDWQSLPDIAARVLAAYLKNGEQTGAFPKQKLGYPFF